MSTECFRTRWAWEEGEGQAINLSTNLSLRINRKFVNQTLTLLNSKQKLKDIFKNNFSSLYKFFVASIFFLLFNCKIIFKIFRVRSDAWLFPAGVNAQNYYASLRKCKTDSISLYRLTSVYTFIILQFNFAQKHYLNYEHQLVKAVHKNNRCLLSKPNKSQNYTLWWG